MDDRVSEKTDEDKGDVRMRVSRARLGCCANVDSIFCFSFLEIKKKK